METSLNVNLNPKENLLKQIRQALDMTQEEFGRTIGVHQTSVARWETGRSKPTFTIAQIKALQKEMRKLNLDFDDLPDDIN